MLVLALRRVVGSGIMLGGHLCPPQGARGVYRVPLAPHGGLLTGLPGYGPTLARPTGKTIFEALGDLRLIPAHDGNPAVIPKPAGIQARLLDLLKIDISRPRWLTQ